VNPANRPTCAPTVSTQPAITRLRPACDPALDAVARAAGLYGPSRSKRLDACCTALHRATATPPPGSEEADTPTPDPQFVRAILGYGAVLAGNGSASAWAVVYVLRCFP
jgi:hypothetical protein